MRRLDRAAAKPALVRYLSAVAVGNVVWEAFQLPLYRLWRTASPAYLVFAALHCWLGDLLIGIASLRSASLPRGAPGRRAATRGL